MSFKRIFRFCFRFFLATAGIACGFWGMIWFSYQNFSKEYTQHIPYITDSVKIVLDRDDIPHIQAKNPLDVYRGLGYMHAKNRLWQMEMERLKLLGGLSFVLGEKAIPSDQFYQALNLKKIAKRTWDTLDQNSRDILTAYSDGVNAILLQKNSFFSMTLPFETLLTWHKPALWRPEDSLLLMTGLELSQSVGLKQSLNRLSLLPLLDGSGIELMIPPLTESDTLLETASPFETQITTLKQVYKEAWNDNKSPTDFKKWLNVIPNQDITGRSWAVGTTRTTTDGSIMGVQMETPVNPNGLWYLAHLNFADSSSNQSKHIIGATIVGIPLVLEGRNENIAWSMTPTAIPTLSLRLEKVIQDNKDTGQLTVQSTQGKPFTIQRSFSKIGSLDSVLGFFGEYSETEKGVLLPESMSKAYGLNSLYRLSLEWPSFKQHNTHFQTMLSVTRSSDMDEFYKTLHQYKGIPQRVVVADTTGNIAYSLIGQVPRYKTEASIGGQLPTPAWDKHFDSTLQPVDIIQLKNPYSGGIVADSGGLEFLNQNPDYRPITEEKSPFNHAVIQSLLNGRLLHTVDSFNVIQQNQTDKMAEILIPLLVSLVRSEGTPLSLETEKAMNRLLGWDNVLRSDGSEPLLSALWLRFLGKRILEDEIPENVYNTLPSLSRTLQLILTFRPEWCDRTDTLPLESCSEMVKLALDDAVDVFHRRFPEEKSSWGKAHSVLFQSDVFQDIPVVNRFFRVSLPVGGGNDTVSSASYSLQGKYDFSPYKTVTYRAIYDLKNPNRSSYMQIKGQSDNPFSASYKSFMNRWTNGEMLVMSTDPLDYELGKNSLINLEPLIP